MVSTAPKEQLCIMNSREIVLESNILLVLDNLRLLLKANFPQIERLPISYKMLAWNSEMGKMILIFKITTGDLDLLGDLDQFQIDLDLWVIFDL